MAFEIFDRDQTGLLGRFEGCLKISCGGGRSCRESGFRCTGNGRPLSRGKPLPIENASWEASMPTSIQRRPERSGAFATGKTDARGLLICEARSPVSGNVILQAEGSDHAGQQDGQPKPRFGSPKKGNGGLPSAIMTGSISSPKKSGTSRERKPYSRSGCPSGKQRPWFRWKGKG